MHPARTSPAVIGIPPIPPKRNRYLAEIAENNRSYDSWAREQASVARRLFQLDGAMRELGDGDTTALLAARNALAKKLDPACREALDNWDELVAKYGAEHFAFQVRGREVNVKQRYETLSHLEIPKVALPRFEDWGERLRWLLTENVPGSFPFAAGTAASGCSTSGSASGGCAPVCPCSSFTPPLSRAPARRETVEV